ncbi:MAG: hypothetical protein VKK42_01915 [Lyngbya sp.]|nr:hypothetical protein [Lyngbya sp.]
MNEGQTSSPIQVGEKQQRVQHQTWILLGSARGKSNLKGFLIV